MTPGWGFPLPPPPLGAEPNSPSPPAAPGGPPSPAEQPAPAPGPQHLPLHPPGSPRHREWGVRAGWGDWGGSGGTQPLKPPLTLPQAGGEDAAAYRAVTEAMATIGFSPEEVGTVCRVLATILLLVRAPPQYGPVQPSAPHPAQQYEPPQPVQPPCSHTHQ